jgi:HNH endonuclease
MRHIIKEKVDIVSSWDDDDTIVFCNETILHPAIIRLKEPFKRNFISGEFSRHAVVKRDNNECQYCAKKIVRADVTIDHILPKSRGGGNSFLNCVVACKACNCKKSNNTPEEVGMKLLRKPFVPLPSVLQNVRSSAENIEIWHDEWKHYIK